MTGFPPKAPVRLWRRSANLYGGNRINRIKVIIYEIQAQEEEKKTIKQRLVHVLWGIRDKTKEKIFLKSLTSLIYPLGHRQVPVKKKRRLIGNNSKETREEQIYKIYLKFVKNMISYSVIKMLLMI